MEHHRPWENTNEPAESDDPEPPPSRHIIHPFSSLRRYLDTRRHTGNTPERERIYFYGDDPAEDLSFKTAVRQIVDEAFTEPPQILYNPGCGRHISLARAFPETRTIFVDEDEFIAEDFAQHNQACNERPFEFFQADMHLFRLPEQLQADVALIFNVEPMTEVELNQVMKEHGIVITNDRHGTAQYMRDDCPNYEFVKKYDYENAEQNLYVFRRKY